MVFQDTLGFWDTRGLESGVYEVRVSVVHTGGDSITAAKDIRLLPAGIGADPTKDPAVPARSLPTVFRDAKSLEAAVKRSGMALLVLDPSGRRVGRLGPGCGDCPALAPGLYFLVGGNRAVHKVIVQHQ